MFWYFLNKWGKIIKFNVMLCNYLLGNFVKNDFMFNVRDAVKYVTYHFYINVVNVNEKSLCNLRAREWCQININTQTQGSVGSGLAYIQSGSE